MSEKFPSGPKDPSSPDLQKAASSINKMRSAERGGREIDDRTAFVLKLIQDGSLQKWQKEGAPSSFDLDTNGLWINVGPEGNFGVHSHIPYEKLDQETVRLMREQKVMIHGPIRTTQGEVLEMEHADREQLELEARIASVQGDQETFSRVSEKQNEYIVEQMLTNPRYLDLDITEDAFPNKQEAACSFLLRDPERMVASLRYNHYGQLHMPVSTLHEFITAPQVDQEGDAPLYKRKSISYRLDRLMGIAEDVNRGGQEIDAMESGFGVNFVRKIAKLTASHDFERVNKSVFEARRARVLGPENYESAKIIETICATYTPESLARLDLHTVRGAYAGGLEFVALWSDEGYHRVLIDPKKHIRDRAAADAYRQIETISRAEFESFEALMLPFAYFEQAQRSVTYGLELVREFTEKEKPHDPAFVERERNGLLIELEGIRSITLTEFSEENYRILEAVLRPLEEKIRVGSWQKDDEDHFVQVLERTAADYRRSFDGTAPQILKDKASPLAVKQITLDEAFVQGFPGPKDTDVRPNIDKDFSRSGAKIRIVESGESGIPYAMEGRAMRALGLERRPALIVTGGAKNLDNEQWGDQTEKMARAILNSAIEFRANVLIPGTQSGLGITLAHKYQEHLQSLNEEERKQAPRFFAIEPGRELYYPGNPILDASESSDVYAVTAVDTIATPYHAGWTNHGTESEQRRHNHYRQLFMKRASEGFPAAIVTANGGGWTALENTAGLHDDFPVIPVADTGRFATLISKMYERKGEWEGVTDTAALMSYIDDMVNTIEPESERASIKKDLSSKLFTQEFVDFLQTGKEKKVMPTSIEDLEGQLRLLLSQQTPAAEGAATEA
jgi:hypothetical protein